MNERKGEVDPIERDFVQALERLKNGTPRHPDLKVLADDDALKITTATVAKEAGHSRTSIGHKNCRYPAIREHILDLRKPRAIRSSGAVIAELRNRVADLQLKLSNAQAEIVALQHASDNAEREKKRYRQLCERLIGRAPASPPEDETKTGDLPKQKQYGQEQRP